MILEEKGKERFVRGMFGRIAPRYDLLNTVLSIGLDSSWRTAAVKVGDPPRGGKCLDLCTGTGELAFLLARVVGESGEVVGLDFCQEMLKIAEVKFRKMYLPHLRFVVGNVLAIPFPDGYFDLVTMAFGLRNLTEALAAFAEMHRVLRPGGRVVNLELTLPENPGLRALYYPYLMVFLPIVGAALSGSLPAYRYLSGSIKGFLSRDGVAAYMKGAGLKEVRWLNLSGGIATIHVGCKA